MSKKGTSSILGALANFFLFFWVESMPLAIQQVLLGRYKIERLVGSGPFGLVYQAFDLEQDSPVAVKNLRTGLVRSAAELHRLLELALAASTQHHPHIVPLYDLIEDHGVYLVVSQWVEPPEGSPAFPHSPEQNIQIISECLETLAQMHAQGITHTNLKPNNFLVGSDGHLKLSDFGLGDPTKLRASFLNKVRLAYSIDQYWAHEQIAGKGVGTRSDVFSLGLVAYELLTGQKYQTATDWAAASVPPGMPSSDRARLERLIPVLIRALAADPAARFRDAGEFKRAFANALVPLPKSPARMPPVAPRATSSTDTLAQPAGTVQPAGMAQPSGTVQRPGGTAAHRTKFDAPFGRPFPTTITSRRAAGPPAAPASPRSPSPIPVTQSIARRPLLSVRRIAIALFGAALILNFVLIIALVGLPLIGQRGSTGSIRPPQVAVRSGTSAVLPATPNRAPAVVGPSRVATRRVNATPAPTRTPRPPTPTRTLTPLPRPTFVALNKLVPFRSDAQCTYGVQDDGLYHVKSLADGIICGAVYPNTYTNVRLVARIRMLDGSGIGSGNTVLILGYQSDQRFLSVMFTRVGRLYSIATWDGNTPHALAFYNWTSMLNRPEANGVAVDDIELAVQANQLYTFANGELISAVALDPSLYKGGKVGVGVYNYNSLVPTVGAASAFERIVIEPLP